MRSKTSNQSDTISRVRSDRRKIIKDMVSRQISLRKALNVFSPTLAKEITRYYKQAQKEIEDENHPTAT